MTVKLGAEAEKADFFAVPFACNSSGVGRSQDFHRPFPGLRRQDAGSLVRPMALEGARPSASPRPLKGRAPVGGQSCVLACLALGGGKLSLAFKALHYLWETCPFPPRKVCGWRGLDLFRTPFFILGRLQSPPGDFLLICRLLYEAFTEAWTLLVQEIAFFITTEVGRTPVILIPFLWGANKDNKVTATANIYETPECTGLEHINILHQEN